MKLAWKAQDVLRAVRGQSLHMQDWTADGVAIDSRVTRKGDLFIAIKGDSMDGHDYAHKAFENGAVAAIVSRPPSFVSQDKPVVHVDDTFAALQELGQAGRTRAHAKIAAVTGSVGKTSSKEMLRLMLGAIDDTYANEGSLNNRWGVPLSLARLPEHAKYGIFELGMNHAGELGPLAREVRPSVALITNVEEVHLEFFASLEAIAAAKAEIFLGMDPSGIAVLNHDSPLYAQLLGQARAQGLKKTLSFGHETKSDARLLDLRADETGTSVSATLMGKPLSFRIGFPGAHLATLALGALLTCAALLEADIETCAQALAAYRPPERRGERARIELGEGAAFFLIDETFNASPIATKAAMANLGIASKGPSGRRIAVLGDMLELGEKSPALHASLAKAIEANGIDIVHCCGPMMTHLYDALPKEKRGILAKDSQELGPKIAAAVHAGDVVTVKGSKGSHMEIVVAALKALEQPVMRKAQG